jgi:DNA-binding transcriptional regulator YbjK
MARMSPVDRRLELVQAALRVIATSGVTAATTRAIVAEAGMSLASFHYAFESRDAMMRELIEFVVEHEANAAFTSMQSGSDVRGAISASLGGYLDGVKADPGREQVMFELMQYALRTPALAALPDEQYSRYRAAVTDLLEAAAAALDVHWTLPVDDVARVVVTITDGLTLAWLADRDDAAADRVIAFAADSLAALASPNPVPAPLSTPTKETAR